MRYLGIVACATALATLPTSAQTTKDKLFEQGEFDAAELRSLGAFDTLAWWYDRSGIGVDTTVVISDSLWMSVLWISDADSVPDDKGSWFHRGGVCEYVFLMTADPRTLRAKALRRIRTECDVDQSIRDATYYLHRILAPTIVEVVSSKPRWNKNDDEDWEDSFRSKRERSRCCRPVGSLIWVSVSSPSPGFGNHDGLSSRPLQLNGGVGQPPVRRSRHVASVLSVTQ